MKPLLLTGEDLTLPAFYDVVLDGRPVKLAPKAETRMAAACEEIRRDTAGAKPAYGGTAGVGKLAHQRTSSSAVKQLQLNLVPSHPADERAPHLYQENRGI